MISVLISVYAGTRPCEFQEALESLRKQTTPATEVVIVKDGAVKSSTDSLLVEYSAKLPLKIVALNQNQGLATALNTGLRHCTQQWVARFDSDDVCLPNRLEAQAAVILTAKFDIIGSNIEEFQDNAEHPVAMRKVPTRHRHIQRYALKRNPFNHMSVCYRRDSVMQVGGYPNIALMEDYALWLMLIASGARMHNIRCPLVRVRVGSGMYARRGGMALLNSERRIQMLMVTLGFKTPFRACLDGLQRGCFFIAPASARKAVYKAWLRKSAGN
jgi:glycosyltransferase involved in cell wall biosynthesis